MRNKRSSQLPTRPGRLLADPCGVGRRRAKLYLAPVRIIRVGMVAFCLAALGLLLSGCRGGLTQEQVQESIKAALATATAPTPTPAPAVGAGTQSPAPEVNPAAVTPVVRAQRFEVVDKSGQVRALLTSLDDGRPTLALMDQKGEFRAWLFLREDGSPNLVLADKGVLVLSDGKGEFRSVLRLDQEGSPSLGLSDKAGTFRSVLRLAADGSPVLVLQDKDGKVIWSAPVPVSP